MKIASLAGQATRPEKQFSVSGSPRGFLSTIFLLDLSRCALLSSFGLKIISRKIAKLFLGKIKWVNVVTYLN